MRRLGAGARVVWRCPLAGQVGRGVGGPLWAAWWLDDVALCIHARERAYQLYHAAGDLRGAARMALWIGDDNLEFRGATAVANGWFQRAARLLERLDPCPEHGWLDTFRAHLLLRTDPPEAEALGARARELGTDLGDVDLEMFGLATEGLALVNQGEVVDGMRCLDEATAAALGGEFEQLAPAGWTCCYMIYACERVRDYDRAAQWCGEVEAFSRRTHIRFVNGPAERTTPPCCVARRLGQRRAGARRCAGGPHRDAAVLAIGGHRAARRPAPPPGSPLRGRELSAQAEHHALADLGVGELASRPAMPRARARTRAAASPAPG